MELELVKQGEFLGTKCDFYKDDNNNIYMTRKQIGDALQYANGDSGIRKIHHRNSDRLDNFSTSVKVERLEGDRVVTRDMIMYNYKGIYEITFMSKKPLAEDFRDWVMNEIEMIRKTGMAMPNPEKAVKEVFGELDEDVQMLIVENYKKKYNEAQKELEVAKETVKKWEAFMSADGYITFNDFSKSLEIEGLGRNNLYKLLREKEVLMDGNYKNMPYQTYITRGYFRSRLAQKRGKKFRVTLITSKGADWLYDKLVEWGVA